MCHRKCFSTRDMGCSSAGSRSMGGERALLRIPHLTSGGFFCLTHPITHLIINFGDDNSPTCWLYYVRTNKNHEFTRSADEGCQ